MMIPSFVALLATVSEFSSKIRTIWRALAQSCIWVGSGRSTGSDRVKLAYYALRKLKVFFHRVSVNIGMRYIHIFVAGHAFVESA